MRHRTLLLSLFAWLFVFTSAQTVAAVAPIRPDYAPGEVARLCQEAILEVNQHLDAIVAVPVASRTFDNTVLAFENDTANFDVKTGPLTFRRFRRFFGSS